MEKGGKGSAGEMDVERGGKEEKRKEKKNNITIIG